MNSMFDRFSGFIGGMVRGCAGFDSFFFLGGGASFFLWGGTRHFVGDIR